MHRRLGAGTVEKLEGRQITLDGSTGEVFDGILPMVSRDPHSDPYLRRLLAWAADAPADHPLHGFALQST